VTEGKHQGQAQPASETKWGWVYNPEAILVPCQLDKMKEQPCKILRHTGVFSTSNTWEGDGAVDAEFEHRYGLTDKHRKEFGGTLGHLNTLSSVSRSYSHFPGAWSSAQENAIYFMLGHLFLFAVMTHHVPLFIPLSAAWLCQRVYSTWRLDDGEVWFDPCCGHGMRQRMAAFFGYAAVGFDLRAEAIKDCKRAAKELADRPEGRVSDSLQLYAVQDMRSCSFTAKQIKFSDGKPVKFGGLFTSIPFWRLERYVLRCH
jgi:hypothetical protein